jgi:NADPH:quinone reductase
MSLFDKIKKYWPFGGHRMRAIGFERALTIDQPNVFIEKNILQPKPSDHELLVKVAASAINPVDTKMRSTYQKDGQFRILGFDATGEVIGLGKNVSKFEIGDLVYYAGVQINPGANAQYQVVNESLVGHAPVKISVAETAAMPLTSITAVEILQSFGFDVIENEGIGKSVFYFEWCWRGWLNSHSTGKIFRANSDHNGLATGICDMGKITWRGLYFRLSSRFT